MPSGPVQFVNVIPVMLPSGLVCPLPLLSVAVADDDVQFSVVPVVESASMVVPAVPVTDPPGLMVQVAAETAGPAKAGLVVRQATAAAAAAPSRALPTLVRIGISGSPR